ncbi:hypothetical protein [Clostridium sp.]|uniref:hypothetical protein n=1 Tax=Clostridium sp. TaxID=1506 RepID=UPI0026DD4985|nr:hypothetical protein [Clostridium sp.]MDO5040427.1 hypothetical protein [Clostridium sp.]
MIDKISLSEAEFTLVSKGIAFGVGIGMLIGIFIGDVILFFSLGGVCGILSTSIYSMIKRLKKSEK